jgi:hypothetical protein
MKRNIKYIFTESETIAVRFWFGLITLGYGFYLPTVNLKSDFVLAIMLMPAWLWGILFGINGIATIYGTLTSKKSRINMLVECVLGTFCWITIGVTVSMAQGIPGPTLMASMVSLWLLVRYPTWKSE